MINVPMTPDQFAAKKASLQAEHGVSITGNAGTETEHGYTIQFKFDGSNLQLQVLDSPRFVPKGFAEKKIEGWLTA